MGQFVVRHCHEAQRCPARDPNQGAALLNFLSRPRAREYGIEIQGEAVVRHEHALYMIVEAVDERQVHSFMERFASAGSVEIIPASTWASVIADGGCAAPSSINLSAVDAWDPAEACQRAIDAGLVVHRAHPLNLRDLDSITNRRGCDAECSFLRSQSFSDPEARSRHLAS